MNTIYWKIDSIWYYILLLVFIGGGLSIYYYLRNKPKQFIYRFLFGITIMNLTLHFLKIIFPPYVHEFKEYDNLRALRVLGFENICAVNTLLGPFLLSSKNKYVRDYFMFIAFIGGLVALIIPVAPYTTRDLFSFDMFRYFICHFSLMIVPLMMYLFNIHRPNFKRAWALPISFFLCMTLVYINENVTYDLGWIPVKRNFSMVYGFPESVGGISKICYAVVPNFLKNYVDIQGNIVPVAPLVWLIFPFAVYLLPIAYIACSALDFKHFKTACKELKDKLSTRFKAKRLKKSK